MEDLEEFKASKEQGFNPTDRLLNLLMENPTGVTVQHVRELIEQNAQVNKCDVDGRGAALIWALVRGVKLEVLEVLLKASDDLGPSCIQNNNQRMTFLMFSIVTPSSTKRVKEAIVNRMVELKMSMNNVDRDQNTALVYAARYGASDLCELLIKHGAEVNSVSNGFYGAKMTALDYALCDKVKGVLRSHGARTFDEINGKSEEVRSPRRVLSICYDYGGRVRSDSRKRERSGSFELRTSSSPSPSPTSEESSQRPSPPSTNSNSTDHNNGSWWTCSCVRPKGSQ